MTDGDEVVLVVGLLAIAALSRRAVPWGNPSEWVWPIPDATIGGVHYPAVIGGEFGDARPNGETHRGVDVLYRRRSPKDLLSRYPDRTSSGSKMHIAPEGTPIIAARDGVVWSVKRTSRGWSIVISHGKPFATYYTHLESCAFPQHASGLNVATGKATRVQAGDYLGPMGWDPMDKSRLRHLHFAVWVDGTDAQAVDPQAVMSGWRRVSWRFNPER